MSIPTINIFSETPFIFGITHNGNPSLTFIYYATLFTELFGAFPFNNFVVTF